MIDIKVDHDNIEDVGTIKAHGTNIQILSELSHAIDELLTTISKGNPLKYSFLKQVLMLHINPSDESL